MKRLENYKTIGKIAFVIAELLILVFAVFVIREVIITKKFTPDIIGFAGVLIYSQLGILFTVWGVPGVVNFAKTKNNSWNPQSLNNNINLKGGQLNDANSRYP